MIITTRVSSSAGLLTLHSDSLYSFSSSSQHFLIPTSPSPSLAPPISKPTKGVLVSLVGVLVLTPDTLLIRATGHLHPPTLLFYRYGLHAFSILCFIISQNGKQTLTKLIEIGWIGVLCGLIFGTSNIFFTTAVQYTAVANVLVILAINPLFSALFSWILVGDVIKVRTAATMLVGLGAISLIFYDEMSGGSSSRVIVGNIFACCTSVLMGLFFALVRYFETKQNTKINMVPCNAVAGLFVATVALMLGARPGSSEVWAVRSSASASPLLLLLLQGLIVLPISFSLLTLAPRYLTAPEVSLFLLIETCLGPLWVFLGGYEAPPPNTVIGGSVLMVALSIHSYLAIREEMESTDRDDSEPVAVLQDYVPVVCDRESGDGCNESEGGGAGMQLVATAGQVETTVKAV